MNIKDGLKEIPIEERGQEEMKYIYGKVISPGQKNESYQTIGVYPESSRAHNYAFDVTPARLVTALITDRGICQADEPSILKLLS
jgi:methylthioribose-1-phosphate isomerase